MRISSQHTSPVTFGRLGSARMALSLVQFSEGIRSTGLGFGLNGPRFLLLLVCLKAALTKLSTPEPLPPPLPLCDFSLHTASIHLHRWPP